tara:strand:- start:19768 stop:20226 length:459 start_codon:yes stop_codon:yes gene_type:complete
MEIKLALYDFDGVMTDNKVSINEKGLESVIVNRSDGLAVKLIDEMGVKQIIISTESNKVVEKRAQKLGIECKQNIENKASVVEELSKTLSITKDKIAFIGNDINDLEAMKIVGLSLCPSDASQEIIDLSMTILPSKGGSGVIRDFYDFLINN